MSAGTRWNDWNTKPTRCGAQARAAVFIELREIGAGEPHVSGSGRIEPREQREQGGLARARRADDRDRLARRDLERNVIDDGQQTFRAANLLCEVFGFENTVKISSSAPGRSAFAGGSSRAPTRQPRRTVPSSCSATA